MVFGKKMNAQYGGTCAQCRRSIVPGDEIEFVRSDEIYHYRCRPAFHKSPSDPRSLGQQGFLFVDLETGGLDEVGCAIVQIAAIATTNNLVILDHFKTYVRPQMNLTITEKATEVHGMTRELLAGAPSEEVALQKFATWANKFSGFRFAGYNCPFDLRFLAEFFFRNQFDEKLWLTPPFDVLDLAKEKLRGVTVNQKLVTVAEFFKLPNEGAHDALFDLFMTVQVTRELDSYAP